MAFSYKLAPHDATGRGIVRGSYANAGGTTGGDIPTGLSRVECMKLTPVAAAVTNAHVINETVDTAGTIPGTVTIVTGANESGMFEAIGY